MGISAQCQPNRSFALPPSPLIKPGTACGHFFPVTPSTFRSQFLMRHELTTSTPSPIPLRVLLPASPFFLGNRRIFSQANIERLAHKLGVDLRRSGG